MRKVLIIFMVMIVLFCTGNVLVDAVNLDSNSKEININSVEEYKTFALNNKEKNGYEGMTINLMVDLDFNGSENNITPMVEGKFKGTFNGNGHSFNNIYLKRDDIGNVALFLENEGTIKKIIVQSGKIYNKHSAAAIAGKNLGVIEQCANYIDIEGGFNVGGICSWNEDGIVRYCYNVGNIIDMDPGVGGTVGYGGIVGNTYSGCIVKCYSTGTIAPERSHSKSNISGWFWDDDKHYTDNCFYLSDKALEGDSFFEAIGFIDYSQDVLGSLNSNVNAYKMETDGKIVLDMNRNINESTDYIKQKINENNKDSNVIYDNYEISDEGYSNSISRIEEMVDDYKSYNMPETTNLETNNEDPTIDLMVKVIVILTIATIIIYIIVFFTTYVIRQGNTNK